MKLEYIPIEDVLPDPRNPKDHDLGAIIESIRRFGFIAPAIRNETTGKLVAGHGRLSALRLLWEEGGKPPKGIDGGGKTGVWKIPVITGMKFENDDEALAYVVADNRLTELGGWDSEALVDALHHLVHTDEDLLSVTGFDTDDLQRLADDLAGLPPDPPPEDEKKGTSIKCPACGERIVI